MHAIRKRRSLAVNTGILTASALLSRMITMLFQAWLAAHIGASGVGFYQLSGAVTALFTVFAISGARFATTRIVSETAANRQNVSAVMKRCFLYAAVFGSLSGCLLYIFAEPLGFLWIGDARVVRSLRIAAAVMPIAAFSSVFAGYFTASGSVWKPAVVSILEQILVILFTIVSLQACDAKDLAHVCAVMTGSSAAAAGISLTILIPLYAAEARSGQTAAPQKVTNRLLGIALPLAVSSYVRAGLGTIEHLLIPRGLRRSGLGAEAALAGYGMVHGMALPAVLFPACLLFALAELVVPLMTEAQMKGETERIHQIVGKLRRGTLLFAVAAGAFLMAFAEPIARYLYHTPDAAKFIRFLAPLIPVMNLDTVTDGCLRGLGQQRRVMRINILDAALGVALVAYLVPAHGISGYVQMIWITECVNCVLSSFALSRSMKRSPAFAGDPSTHYALL